MSAATKDLYGFSHATLTLREMLARFDEAFSCNRDAEHCFTCSSTDKCRKVLDHFCEELLDFMQERFRIESDVMHLLKLTRPNPVVIVDHQEAHDKLMQTLTSLISSNMPTAAARTAFRKIITTWLYEHAPAHDMALVEVLKRS